MHHLTKSCLSEMVTNTFKLTLQTNKFIPTLKDLSASEVNAPKHFLIMQQT